MQPKHGWQFGIYLHNNVKGKEREQHLAVLEDDSKILKNHLELDHDILLSHESFKDKSLFEIHRNEHSN